MAYSNIHEVLLGFTQALGKMIYDKSQELVPVKSGNLKNSGEYTFSSTGATVTYYAPYAHRVNFGGEGEAPPPDFTYTVRQHQRRVPTGQVIVKEHIKKMGVRRPKATKPQGFLTRAKEEILGDGRALEAAWIKAHGTASPEISAPPVS